MKSNYFGRLTLNDRLMLIINEGTFVAEIIYSGYRIRLHILDNEYVESFIKIDGNVAQSTERFQIHEGRLREYAKVMDITQLPGVEVH